MILYKYISFVQGVPHHLSASRKSPATRHPECHRKRLSATDVHTAVYNAIHGQMARTQNTLSYYTVPFPFPSPPSAKARTTQKRKTLSSSNNTRAVVGNNRGNNSTGILYPCDTCYESVIPTTHHLSETLYLQSKLLTRPFSPEAVYAPIYHIRKT